MEINQTLKKVKEICVYVENDDKKCFCFNKP